MSLSEISEKMCDVLMPYLVAPPGGGQCVFLSKNKDNEKCLDKIGRDLSDLWCCVVNIMLLPDLENDVSLRLIKTFGRLKGRALSNNQKVGLEMLEKK